MNEPTSPFLPYTEIRKRLRAHFLRQSEIPTEHTVSLPLPTGRCGTMGYAFFAGPAVRLSGQPLEQGAPDRWWVFSATNGHLLLYALCSAAPFAEVTWPAQTILSATAQTIAEAREASAKTDKLLDHLAPQFFSRQSVDQNLRRELKSALEAVLAKELWAQYRALAPDFWAWLEAN